MDAAAVASAIAVVTAVCDDAIRRVVTEQGGRATLADKMIARKADLARRLG